MTQTIKSKLNSFVGVPHFDQVAKNKTSGKEAFYPLTQQKWWLKLIQNC